MDEKRTERLLREYAKHVPGERLFSEETAERLRRRLRPAGAADHPAPADRRPQGPLPRETP